MKDGLVEEMQEARAIHLLGLLLNQNQVQETLVEALKAVLQEAKLAARQEVLKVVSLVVYLEEPKVVDALATVEVVKVAL